MTTDPPPGDFEDVKIGNWEGCLPTGMCTNREIFGEILSLETWKTVLEPEQRERILKLLPPELQKTQGTAEKGISDLLERNFQCFGGNPLDTFFDNLENGHYDPEVVETKQNIVREWKRESIRLRKHYHTKLLQDIVISRDNHLRRLIPPEGVKKNGKKSATAGINGTGKKNGKDVPNGINANNGVGGGAKGVNNYNQLNNNNNSFTVKSESVGRKGGSVSELTGRTTNKRGRLETALLSPPGSLKDAAADSPLGVNEGPSKKKAKSASSGKNKGSSGKKGKDSIQPPPSPSSQLLSSSLLLGNGTGNQKSTLLLNSLTAGGSPLEPPTLSLRSPSSLSGGTSSSSLLESLTSPVNPIPNLNSTSTSVVGNESGGTSLSKQFSKIFPSPILTPSPASTSQSPSFLPSPVQSSPILASQLQAPSPISVNLSAITGGLTSSSRNGSISGSPSHSSITLNYTQPPTPTNLNPSSTITSLQHQQSVQSVRSLLDDDSSSDEFEFETIEPTIGFTGPSNNKASLGSGGTKPPPTSSIGVFSTNSCTTTAPRKGPISSQELANIQKCSLLTNCLTQPLSSNSSSNAAVTAALANNILTSTPVPASATLTLSSGGGHHGSSMVQQLLQQQQPIPTQKILVSSSGLISSSIQAAPQAQLQKLLSVAAASSNHSATQFASSSSLQKVQQQQLGSVFSQQLQKNVIAPSASMAVDAQTFVNTLMSGSKDLLSALSSSMGGVVTANVDSSSSQSVSSSNVLPISVNLQGLDQQQLKQTFVRGTINQQQQPQQLLPSANSAPPIMVVSSQGSSLNTQSLQLPSSILTGGGGNKVNLTGLASSSVVGANSSSSISNLLDSDDLNLNLGSFSLGSLGGMNLDIGGSLPEIDSAGGVDGIKLEMDCGMDKMDDLSGVLDGNPFDSIPNLSDELDGLDLDMVDGLCDFEVLLSEEKQYSSFFSLIRDVLCSTRDHRMTLVCLEKTIKKWALSPAAALNPWYMRVPDWTYALVVGLNFLAGNYQDIHPEDFVPYIEYKYKTKFYQWIGAGRDGDNNLTPLCSLWMDNLDKLPPLRKVEADGDEQEEEEDENEDSDAGIGDPAEPRKKNKRPQTPPPPRCTTEWSVRPSTETEKDEFRSQEKHRFENPHKAFTYRMHGYESVVGPVKGVYSSQTGVTNKARGHSLLVDDRPPYVTILALVRDAVARLPNGEGTRSEICEMLRDSAFLAPEASNVTLNSVVSGALDRLHYERDPCVRYDSHKKSWIYLHRDRSQEQFERLHHNRSYTKSTKSRNNTSRKTRKGSKGSSSSTAPSSTTGTFQSSSNSSSQCSTSAIVESSLPAVGTTATVNAVVGSGGTAITSTAGTAVVAIPSLSTINPGLQSQLASLQASPVASVTHQPKQTIGIVSLTNPTSVQVQGQTQQASALQQALANGRSGIVNFPGTSTLTLSDGQQQQQASLNDVLAAAAGLRFQSNASGGATPVVLNPNLVSGGQQQGNKQTAFLQDSGNGTTARLVLQQQQPQQTLQQGGSIQVQTQQQISGQGNSATALGPGQILLGSSAAAVLKLAGNIRLGEGLRLAQLRLPSGSPGQQCTTATLNATSGSSPLRLPQHRILLARGTLPGQSQAQGVLLGQTSTGQTVILSAGPAGGNPLAGLQQALANGSSGAATGQIAIHAAPSQHSIQLDSSTSSTNSPSLTHQTQQQHTLLQSFATNANSAVVTTSSAAKFGLLTNVTQGGNVSQLGVSSSVSPSPIMQSSYSTSPIQQTSSTPTLPPTSISLPASFRVPSTANGALNIQSPPNITVTSSQHPPPQQHQLIFTSGATTGSIQQPIQTSTSNPQQITTTLGMSPVQLQSSLQQAQQNLILQQPQQTLSQPGSQQSQPHHQLTAPIIIRSSQGDFVSFGIPSHLSLSRGVQGIKVIPFQSGKQTVLARIVAPPSTSSNSNTGTLASTPMAVPTSALPSTLTNAVVSSNLNSSSTPTVQQQIPSLPSPQSMTTPLPPPYIPQQSPQLSPQTSSPMSQVSTTPTSNVANNQSSINLTAIAPGTPTTSS